MTLLRKIIPQDLEHLKAVIDSTGLFPSELLNDMTNDFFNNKNTTDIWLTKEVDGKPEAVVYCAPERMTNGTFNLYLIAIKKTYKEKELALK